MQLLEVFTPDLDTFVRYKVLDPMDVDLFVEENGQLPREEYVRKVLELVVFNLRSEVTDVLRVFKNKETAKRIVAKIYNGCVMLNPGLDVNGWLELSEKASTSMVPQPEPEEKPKPKKRRANKLTKAKFLGLESHLKDVIVGQDEAVDAVASSLKRSVAGLSDEERPIGVFLFAGASGVGKSQMAKELHSYLFGQNVNMVRIDCGEYQQKHENQKLLGSPPGYVAHDEGGQLTNQMKKSPHTVVLLDEVEKAHPDIWNTFLRIFDEGMVTDNTGKEVSFRNAVIVMTTNLGNRRTVDDILGKGMGFGNRVQYVDPGNATTPERRIVERHTNEAIREYFRPEFLNRIDNVVVFNHLSKDDLKKIAELELQKVEEKLSKRGVRLVYDDNTLEEMIATGVNPVEGARGISRVRRDRIEDVVSDALLSGARWRGAVMSLSFEDGEYQIDVKRPSSKKAAN